MIIMITLTISALLILIAGLMEIRMPFVSASPDGKPEKKMPSKKFTDIKEKLVKNSVDNTVRNTRLLKRQLNNNIF